MPGCPNLALLNVSIKSDLSEHNNQSYLFSSDVLIAVATSGVDALLERNM